MSERLREIQRRRAALIALSDIQRATLALQVHRWERPIGYFDAGFAAARSIGTRPIVILLGIALLARSRWPRLGRLLEYSSIAWQAFSTAREFLPKRRAATPSGAEAASAKAQ